MTKGEVTLALCQRAIAAINQTPPANRQAEVDLWAEILTARAFRLALEQEDHSCQT